MKYFVLLFLFLFSIFSYSQTGTKPARVKGVEIDTLQETKSLNRAWSPNELQQGLNYIITHQKDSNYVIPTLTNKEKELFIKLTNYDSYWFLNTKYQTLDERFKNFITIYEPVNNLQLVYYQKSKIENGKLSYEKEITDIHYLLVKLSIDQVKLADEFITANPNLTKIQLDGLKKMTYGINTILSSELTILEKEYSYFSSASVCKICDSFKNFYLFMYKKIDSATKIEFANRIEVIVKKHEIGCVIDILKDIQK